MSIKEEFCTNGWLVDLRTNVLFSMNGGQDTEIMMHSVLLMHTTTELICIGEIVTNALLHII